MTPDALVRAALADDAPAIAGFAAELYRMHHRLDPVRFWDLGGDEPARRAGRERFFASLVGEAGTRLLVGEHAGKVVGYAYATFESHDYMNLLERAVWLHDLYVEPEARSTGLADALFAAVCREAEAAGVSQVVFTVAAANARATAFFARQGARLTMREMAVTLPRAGDGSAG